MKIYYKKINYILCLTLLFFLQSKAYNTKSHLSDKNFNKKSPLYSHNIKTAETPGEEGEGEGNTETIYLEPFSPRSEFSINQSKSVGRTMGYHSVTPTGGASYSIPIPIPPGTSGLVPSIALAYNSMGSNGFLGMGWSVTGLSSISRGNHNFFHDGEIEEIQLDKEDVYYLDGNRLMLMSGTYGVSGSVYGGEAESFSIITAVGSETGGPKSFRVKTKGGLTYEYGGTSDSKKKHSTGVILSWNLNKITDCNGNYIKFTYKDVNNEFLLDEILYTGNSNAGLAPYNSIKFNYGSRTDENTLYNKGDSFNQTHLLNSITIKGENNQSFKSFHFNYAFKEGHSLLRELTEKGTNGSALNSTKFVYGETPQNIAIESTTTTGKGHGKDVFTGDYNGDGRSDLLLAFYAYDANGIKYHTDFQVFHRDHTNSVFNYAYNVNIGSIVQPNYSSIQNLPTSDYNGDGLSDILAATIYKSSSWYKLKQLNRILTNYNGSTPSSNTVLNPPATYDVVYPSGNYFSSGDFDGDGKGDYLLILSDKSSYRAFLSLEGGNNPNNQLIIEGIPNSSATRWAQADKLLSIDFNGDGKNDLMVVTANSTTVYTFKLINGTYHAKILYSSSFPDASYAIFPGDFNGDGKTDLLTKKNSSWSVLFSNGVNFSTGSFSPANYIDLADDKLAISDFNGDGKSDILHAYNNWSGGTSSNSTLQIYFSEGKIFNRQIIHSSAPLLGFGPLVLGDFNGDGRSDAIQQTHYNSPMDIFLFKPFGTERLLEKIVDGHGFTTNFSYKPLTEGGNFYNKGAEKPYPMIKVTPPIYTVEKTSIPDGIGGLFTTNYSYNSAHFHRQGRGFLGFERIISVNNVNVNKDLVDYTFNTSYYSAVPGKHTVMHKVTNDNIYVNIPSTTFNSLSNDRFWVSTDQLEELDYPRDAKNLHTMVYDSYGNLTSKQSQIGLSVTGGGTNNHKEYVTENYSEHVSLCEGNPAFPQIITTSNQRTGESMVSKTTHNTYNSNGLVQRIEYANTPNPVQVDLNQFNVFGNVEESQISSPGLPTRVTKKSFDPKGRYAVALENELGQVENRIYHPLWGQAEEITTIDGLTTQQTFDPFGRTTTITNSLNKTTDASWIWDDQTGSGTGSTTVNNAIYHQKMKIPGYPDQEVYYDILDRKRMTKSDGHNGQTVYTVTSYTNQGQVKTTSTPFYNAASAVITTNIYDDYGRIINVHDNVSLTSYSYSSSNGELTTTTSLPNNSTNIMVTDGSGKTISTTDNGGSLYFTYDSYGNTTKISNGSFALNSMKYDSYGRQKSLFNVDAGTTLYDYNAYGQLVSQTNANGNQQTMQYDVVGRTTSKQGSEGTTTYDYVTSGNGLNQLKKMTGFNNIEKSYTYDTYGRLNELNVLFANQATSFSCEYSYDPNGRNDLISYSSGVDIHKSFNAVSGHLSSIYSSDNGALPILLYEANDIDALGNHTEYTLGNGVQSVHTYNNHGYPERYATNGGIQDLELNWDMVTGNLDSRIDHIKGLNESFLYDNMDRLDMSLSLTAPQVNTSYDPDGSISFNDPAGIYQPWATVNNRVRKISNPNTNISLSKQKITYTSFNEPDQIMEDGNTMTFIYGPDYRRIQSYLTGPQDDPIFDRWYVPEVGFEMEYSGNGTNQIHYVNANGRLIAMLVKEKGASPSSTQVEHFYTYTDHLGSILTVTDENATIVAEQNFDAWGRRRDPNTWQYVASLTANPTWLYRGYTAHEQLDRFELVHMNGRLYAPKTGMMLSPDNFAQNPFSTQSHNRYAYAFNNPLKYTDPSGEIVWAAPVAIGAALGGFSGWQIGKTKGAQGWEMAGYIFGGAAIGAISGGTASAISTAGGGAFISGAVGGAIGGGGSTALSGGSGAQIVQGVFTGFASGGVGGALGSAIGGGGGAFAGGAAGSGLNAKLNGASWEDAGKAALGGGLTAFGAYHASSYIGWKFQGGNKMGDLDISYRQYTAMQADFQRSRFWGKEYGGALMTDGSVKRFGADHRAHYQMNGVKMPQGAKGWYHTHWDAPGLQIDVTPKGNRIVPGGGYNGPGSQVTTEQYHSPADMLNPTRSIVINRYNGSYFSGSGSYRVITPPINRFVYSFLFWR